MIRLTIFLAGLVAFLVGVASHWPRIPLPVDVRTIVWSIGPSGFSLDVILMVVGVFFMLIAWAFHRLSQS